MTLSPNGVRNHAKLPHTPIKAASQDRLDRRNTSSTANAKPPIAFRVCETKRESIPKAKRTTEKDVLDLRPDRGSNRQSAMTAKNAPDCPTALEPVAGRNPLRR